MAQIRTKGLVIREVAVDDNDKIITLITEDIGKVSVSARGARKSGSRYSYGTQVLTYGEFILFRARNSLILDSCDIITSFYDLAGDMEQFTYAAHMIEMTQDASTDEHTTAGALNLLLHALNALIKGRNPVLISSAFILKLMQLTGYPPHVTGCVSCGTTEMDRICFSFNQCGFICERCAASDSSAIGIEPGTAKALLHVMCSDNAGAFRFDLSADNLEALSYIAKRYIAERLDKRYAKLDLLKELGLQTYDAGGSGR
jgi:DNA repair protein RecO (recombination protein O)